MSDLSNLRASCQAILARHQLNSNLDLTCVICRQRVRGQGSSMEHYISSHNIFTTHYDDIVDLDGFFSYIQNLIFPQGEKNKIIMQCPVCLTQCCNESVWVTHMQQEGHNYWNIETIPALAPFCVMCIDNTNKEETDNNNNNDKEEEEEVGEYNENEEDEDEDWDTEPALCLLCDTTSTDCLSHMIEVHSLNFSEAVRSHSGVNDEYDIIRIVNVIRKSVAQGVCPYHYNNNNNNNKDSQSEVELCRQDIAATSLKEHLQSHPSHLIPQIIPSGDRELIPVICGDAFISSIVLSGDLLGDKIYNNNNNNKDEPDYPMVPTLLELARMHATLSHKTNSLPTL